MGRPKTQEQKDKAAKEFSARRKRSVEGTPRTTVDVPAMTDEMLEGMGACCLPVTLGHFRDQTLVALFKRHVGRRCAPQIETMDIRSWMRSKGLLK